MLSAEGLMELRKRFRADGWLGPVHVAVLFDEVDSLLAHNQTLADGLNDWRDKATGPEGGLYRTFTELLRKHVEASDECARHFENLMAYADECAKRGILEATSAPGDDGYMMRYRCSTREEARQTYGDSGGCVGQSVTRQARNPEEGARLHRLYTQWLGAALGVVEHRGALAQFLGTTTGLKWHE